MRNFPRNDVRVWPVLLQPAHRVSLASTKKNFPTSGYIGANDYHKPEKSPADSFGNPGKASCPVSEMTTLGRTTRIHAMRIACKGILDMVETESYTTNQEHTEYQPAVTLACMYPADTSCPKRGVGWRQKRRDVNALNMCTHDTNA